jgi:hypothetical protein
MYDQVLRDSVDSIIFDVVKREFLSSLDQGREAKTTIECLGILAILVFETARNLANLDLDCVVVM